MENKSKLEATLILEGILFGIIGILFFINPIESYFSFTTVAGILLIIAGIFRIMRAFKTDEKAYYIFNGIINILFGLIVWFTPVSTTQTLILFYGIWALIRGIYLLILSIKRKKIGFNVNTLYNISLIVLGLLILSNPIVTLLATPYIIGIYFIVSAICEIYLGFQL
ncbi:HdeD family acid-resistance protein [Paraclostridium bifermentans]|uniref:HdeD family acid-resistance protein n=1 Tax=Paraclostridium bifermentans TaxID=1490 RepID=UPI00359C401C